MSHPALSHARRSVDHVRLLVRDLGRLERENRRLRHTLDTLKERLVSTQIPLSQMSPAELARLAHEVHCGRREPGHSAEVQVATCPHPNCQAIRAAMDQPKVEP